MTALIDHIERVRQQPHHVKKQVAMVSAIAGTALIALVWFVGNVAFGTFALNTNPSANAPAVVTESQNDSLAGAASALPPGVTPTVPAHIEIVDGPSATGTKRADQTTIPF